MCPIILIDFIYSKLTITIYLVKYMCVRVFEKIIKYIKWKIWRIMYEMKQWNPKRLPCEFKFLKISNYFTFNATLIWHNEMSLIIVITITTANLICICTQVEEKVRESSKEKLLLSVYFYFIYIHFFLISALHGPFLLILQPFYPTV